MPLLANLPWFDALFHGPQGPARPHGATLVRYADGFVVLVKRMTPEIREFIASRLEGKFGLEINREKTQVVNLKEEEPAWTFQATHSAFDRDLHGRRYKYLNVMPSRKAVLREQQALHAMTGRDQNWKPLPKPIGELNRQTARLGTYFCFGYPAQAYWRINWCARQRLFRHLERRRQRPYRISKGEPMARFFARLGLPRLGVATAHV